MEKKVITRIYPSKITLSPDNTKIIEVKKDEELVCQGCKKPLLYNLWYCETCLKPYCFDCVMDHSKTCTCCYNKPRKIIQHEFVNCEVVIR